MKMEMDLLRQPLSQPAHREVDRSMCHLICRGRELRDKQMPAEVGSFRTGLNSDLQEQKLSKSLGACLLKFPKIIYKKKKKTVFGNS